MSSVPLKFEAFPHERPGKLICAEIEEGTRRRYRPALDYRAELTHAKLGGRMRIEMPNPTLAPACESGWPDGPVTGYAIMVTESA